MINASAKASRASGAAMVAGAIAGLHFLAGVLLILYLVITPNVGGGGDPGSHIGAIMGYFFLVGPLWIAGCIVSLLTRPWKVGLALLAINQAPLLLFLIAVSL